jgi:prevent-host-death family protein
LAGVAERRFCEETTGCRSLPRSSIGRRRVTTSPKVATLLSMKVATSSRIDVGVRDLKNNLSRYLDQVRTGVEVVVTDRGRPIARLSGIDDVAGDKLAALIEAGLVRPPTAKMRQRPVPLRSQGSVSELVAEQRR